MITFIKFQPIKISRYRYENNPLIPANTRRTRIKVAGSESMESNKSKRTIPLKSYFRSRHHRPPYILTFEGSDPVRSWLKKVRRKKVFKKWNDPAGRWKRSAGGGTAAIIGLTPHHLYDWAIKLYTPYSASRTSTHLSSSYLCEVYERARGPILVGLLRLWRRNEYCATRGIRQFSVLFLSTAAPFFLPPPSGIWIYHVKYLRGHMRIVDRSNWPDYFYRKRLQTAL